MYVIIRIVEGEVMNLRVNEGLKGVEVGWNC